MYTGRDEQGLSKYTDVPIRNVYTKRRNKEEHLGTMLEKAAADADGIAEEAGEGAEGGPR